MIFLIDEIPKYCPKCGTMMPDFDGHSRHDFFAGASHACIQKCGVSYQYVRTQAILDTAETCGDMARYVEA